MLNRILIVAMLVFCLTQCKNESYKENVQLPNRLISYKSAEDVYQENTYINIVGDTLLWCCNHKTTNVESYASYYFVMKEYQPKTVFEVTSVRSALSYILNIYLSNRQPYDIHWSCPYISPFYKQRYRDEYKDINFDEYDREQLKKWSQDTLCMRIKRGDFWNGVFDLNREFSNPESFAVIEKAIREMHDIWGLDMNDTIYMQKNAYAVLRSTYNDIFTNMRDEINPIYLK